jgi:hypothetical protein
MTHNSRSIIFTKVHTLATTTTVAPNRHDNDNEGRHLQHQPIPNPKPPRRVEAAIAAARRDSSRAPGMFFFFFLHEHASTNFKLYISTWQTKYMSWSAISTLILHRANSFLGIDAHVYEETLRTEGGYNGTQPYVYCRHQ